MHTSARYSKVPSTSLFILTCIRVSVLNLYYFLTLKLSQYTPFWVQLGHHWFILQLQPQLWRLFV